MSFTQKIKEKWNFTSSNKKTILTRIIGAVTLGTLGFSILLNVGQHGEVAELTENQTELEKEVINYQLENEDLVNDLVAANDSYISLSKESEQLVNDKEELEAKIEELESKLEEKKDKNEQLKNDKSSLETELKKEKDKNSNFNQEKDGSDEPKVSGEIIQNNETGFNSFSMTSYIALCRSGCSGVTKTGVDVTGSIYHQGKRVIAVDPNVIPLNSHVTVKREDGSQFEAIAIDTGGAIKGNIVDLLVGSEEKAWKNGRESVLIRINN